MEPITLRELLEAVKGTLLGAYNNLDTIIARVDTDSRTIHDDALFIPLVGDRFDGHAYINAALEGGALGCLTARERESYHPDKFYVKVSGTQRALRDLAAWYKSKFDIPYVAVTGSVGKTTTKDMLAAVLSTKYNVLKTEGNHNNNIGLPLTLLRLNKTHEICVLEMGMDRPGEIDYLGDIVKPDVGVITNIGDAHIEWFGSREEIFKAKTELLPHINPNGLLVLNGDDELLQNLRGKTAQKTVFCGEADQNEYRATRTEQDGESRMRCWVRTPGMNREVDVPALGAFMIYPTLTAIAVGEYFGLDSEQLLEGVLRFVPTRMRMNILRREDDITILNDTYNANPQSMRAAIQVLADSNAEWRIAVLGDMFELGPFAAALHTSVGECIGKTGIDCLIAVGELAANIADGAESAGLSEIYRCSDKEAAKQVLPKILRPGATILLKASRGMALEELTEELLSLTNEKK